MGRGMMAQLVVAALASAVVLWRGRRVAFTPSNPRPAIVGGTPASPSRYPYFASLMYNKQPFCGGVLVSKDRVLTASHCLGFGQVPVSKLASIITVQIGGTEERRIRSISFHPKLDIATVTLQTPSAQQPIPFVVPTSPLKASEPLTLLGRGQKSATDTMINSALQKAQLTYVDVPSVLRLMDKEPRLDADTKAGWRNMLQASAGYVIAAIGPPGRSACFGDSGGPLIREKGPGRDELVGLASVIPGTSDGAYCGEGLQRSYQFFVDSRHILPRVTGRAPVN